MTEKERVSGIISVLDKRYGSGLIPTLDYSTPWQLLVATVLSAQCTDERVNKVTPDLFKAYPDLYSMAGADKEDVERLIKSAGFWRQKARNIIGSAIRIVDAYKGEVPDNMEDLLTLPGVGRKTASVILGHVYKVPSIVVDTHVKRVSFRLGLTGSKDPEKVESDLKERLPEDRWIDWNSWIIRFGREICRAAKPCCGTCPLSPYCPGKM